MSKPKVSKPKVTTNPNDPWDKEREEKDRERAPRFELLPGNEEPMQVLSLRLRAKDVEELDRRAAESHGGNRSAAVRAWLERGK